MNNIKNTLIHFLPFKVSVLRKLFVLFIICTSGATASAQWLNGPELVMAGQTYTYTLYDDVMYWSYSWYSDKGYLVNSSQSGATYTAEIYFHSTGPGVVQFLNEYLSPVATLYVTVQSPCTPPANPVVSFSITSDTCPPRTISYTGTPPGGIAWYWQTSPTGTDMSYPSTSYAVTYSGTFYVRAYSPSTQCWSTNAASYSATVASTPAMPNTISVSTNTCGAKTLTRGAPPTGVTWYWQGTNFNGTSTANSATTYSADVSGTYYLRARNNSTGCWSLSSRSVVVAITPTLPSAWISSNDCGSSTLTRGTPPTGTVWYWQGTNATGTSTTNSSSTYNVTSSGTYYIRARITSSNCWSPTSLAISVTVNNLPSVPPSPTISSNTCGAKTLSMGAPPAGTTYYWQGNNPSGTDTSYPASAAYTATATSWYYVKARNNTTGCWSSSSGVSVNVNNPQTPGNGSATYSEWQTMTLSLGGQSYKWYDHQNNFLLQGTQLTVDKPVGTYEYRIRSFNGACESPGYGTITLIVYYDDYLNWSQNIGYTLDASGNSIPTAASKTYADGFGNTLQSQSKSYTTNQVMAAQPIYDRLGNAAASTLPAPINSSSFLYKHKFVTKADGIRYSANDFDLTTGAGSVGNPNPVVSSLPGTLGWYYSTNNNLEPKTPITAYPYSRSHTPEGPDPTTSKAAGPGEQHKMGSNHETSSERQKILVGELDHYYHTRTHFDNATLSQNPNLLAHVSTSTTTQFSPNQGVTIAAAAGYLIVTATQSTSTPGTFPIGGNISVTPGKTYTYRVKGYKQSNQAVNLYVARATGGDIVWPGPVLATGISKEDWTSVTFTVPAGVTSIRVGVLWSQPLSGDKFYLSAVDMRSTVPLTSPGYKYISTDPNGKQAVTYVDADGKTLASCTKNGSVLDNWSYTFYNTTGQVVATVAPNGVNTGSTAYPTFVTTYKYDHLGRLIESTATDEGTTQYVYSLDGKIRFSQNQEQRNATPKRFSYTNYDYLGRLIEAGEYSQSGSNPYIFEPHTTTTPVTNSVLQTATLEAIGYTKVSRKLDATRCTDYTYIEYDGQGSGTPALQSFTYGQVTKTENANASTWYSYDEFGQLVWTKQNIIGLGTKTVEYSYDFLGNVTQVAYQPGQPDKFYHHYIYDADQRLSEVWTSLDGTNKTLRAKYHYYLHGPLKRVELANNVQGIDFVYTITGALKTINNADPANDPGNDGANGFAPDVFGQTMHYYDNDYTGAAYNAGAQTFSGYTNQYGGALKAVSWHSPVDNNKKRSYAFTYDNLYQLNAATFGNNQAGSFNPLASDAYKESIPAYDKNGNIQSLLRKGINGNVMGNYNYIYEANTNKLDKVNHNSALLVDYSYNTIGQMTQQVEGGNTMNVAYNAYGITKEVRNGSNQLMVSYHYDDRGDLVKRTDYNAGTLVKNTFYVRDASGNPLAIYEGTTLIEVPVYGSGRVALFKPQLNTYFYELGDHLGNVRAVIGAPDTDVYTATMESENQATEQPPFKNISARRATFVGANNTPGGNEVVRLNNTQPAGPTLALAVSPGDQINLETWAYYEAGSNYHNTISSTTMIAAIAQAFGGVLGAPGEAGQIYNAINNAFTSGGAALGGTGNPTLPGAYMAYLVFDVNRNLTIPLQAGYFRVTTAGNLAKEKISSPTLTMEHPGYIYTFLYNTSNSANWVYFDDFKVTHQRSPIVAGADFYPFGLPMEGREITQEDYRYGYQGQYAEKDTTTGWNQFQLRMYDARFGRWLSVDPYGQYASPYLAMGNAPQMGVDPDGGFNLGATFVGATIGFAAGAAIGLAADLINDGKINDGYWLKGGLIGAVAGGAYGATRGPISNMTPGSLTPIDKFRSEVNVALGRTGKLKHTGVRHVNYGPGLIKTESVKKIGKWMVTPDRIAHASKTGLSPSARHLVETTIKATTRVIVQNQDGALAKDGDFTNAHSGPWGTSKIGIVEPPEKFLSTLAQGSTGVKVTTGPPVEFRNGEYRPVAGDHYSTFKFNLGPNGLNNNLDHVIEVKIISIHTKGGGGRLFR